jgi:hypothetical protein
VMGNRSDRRLANLSNRWALEAVGPIRASRADFHQGPERYNQLHTEAEYTTATGSPLTSTNDLALGAGSIYEGSNPSRSTSQSLRTGTQPSWSGRVSRRERRGSAPREARCSNASLFAADGVPHY